MIIIGGKMRYACIALFVIMGCAQHALSQDWAGQSGTNYQIPDNISWVNRPFTVSGIPNDANIVGVDAYFRCVHIQASDLIVELKSPSGQDVYTHRLWDRGGGFDPSNTIDSASTFNSVANPNGVWNFWVIDMDAQGYGFEQYLDSVWVRIYFVSDSAPFISGARINNIEVLENLDGDDFVERFSIDVEINADNGTSGSRQIQGTISSENFELFWNMPAWTITGEAVDWHPYTITEVDFSGQLADGINIGLDVWIRNTTGFILWDVEYLVAGEPYAAENAFPWLDSARISGLVYLPESEFPPDGYYDQFYFYLDVDASADNGVSTSVTGRIRCNETGQFWDRTWSVQGRTWDPYPFSFDNTMFSGFAGNMPLTFTVELWDWTFSTMLGQTSNISGQPVLADNDITPSLTTVSGIIQFLDEDNQLHPVRFAQVNIVDTVNGGGESTHIYNSYTDDFGYYSIVIPNTVDPDGSGSDLFVRVLAADQPVVTGIPGHDHSLIGVWKFGQIDSLHSLRNVGPVLLNNSQPTVTINITTPNNSPTDGVFAIFDAGIEGLTGAYDVLGEPIDSAIKIYWPINNVSSGYRYTASPPYISLVRGDRWNRNTIVHEYAHFIADLYDFLDGSVGNESEHDLAADLRHFPVDGTRTDEQARNLAFREAWPSWFALAVQQSDGGGTTFRKIMSANDAAGNYDIDYSYDVDAITGGFPDGCLTTSCDTGQFVEYLNLSTLWDIYDNVNHAVDNYDVLYKGPDEIWSTCTDAEAPIDRPDDIVDFWNHWFDGFGDATLMTRVFLNHHMSFIEIDSAPSNPKPGDLSANHAVNVTLKWDSVPGAESYSVYFGTYLCNYPNLFHCNLQGNTTGPAFELATPLASNSEYWWRVVAKANHAELVGNPWSFTTGNCDCDCLNDPACDGVLDVIDVLDVVSVVGCAFRNVPQTQLPGCDRIQTDMDCDGATTVLDLVKVVRVAFRNLPRELEFCWNAVCTQQVVAR